MPAKRHKFTLILSGISEITTELANSFYEATGGDIEFNMRNGIPFLEFDRSAHTLREAILTAVGEVEEAVAGVRVVRVESATANTIAKINAELLETTVSQ